MRISFVGQLPVPATAQPGGHVHHHVELGNGKRFFFDFGSGCMPNMCSVTWSPRCRR